MNTVRAEHETGFLRLSEQLARRDAKMAEQLTRRDAEMATLHTEMAKRETRIILSLFGIVALATAVVSVVLALLVGSPS